MEKKLMEANTKARPEAPRATDCIPLCDITRPSKPRIINPNKGINSTHRVKFVIIN